jgi:hypothetical protein
MSELTVPAIPASCADRPTVGGIVAPFVNLRLADGGVDFRSPHHVKYERCWKEGLCQVCGQPTGHPAVLFGGPNQLASRHFDEPPLCAPCALYASKACPMVAGQRSHYADRARLSEGQRGHTCPHAGCPCGGWTPSDPNQVDHGGDPAHPWYAVFINPRSYTVTAYKTTVRCSDKGCNHERVLVNGGQLTGPPLKVVLVSAPGEGRIWRRLDPAHWPTATCSTSVGGAEE